VARCADRARIGQRAAQDRHPGFAIDQRVMHLVVDRKAAVRKSLDDIHFQPGRCRSSMGACRSAISSCTVRRCPAAAARCAARGARSMRSTPATRQARLQEHRIRLNGASAGRAVGATISVPRSRRARRLEDQHGPTWRGFSTLSVRKNIRSSIGIGVDMVFSPCPAVPVQAARRSWRSARRRCGRRRTSSTRPYRNARGCGAKRCRCTRDSAQALEHGLRTAPGTATPT